MQQGAMDSNQQALSFTRKVIGLWLPLLYLLISDTFYLRTYDSAQIKITLVQMGGVTLLTLWLCQLAMEGGKIFRREAIVTLAPFLAYFVHTWFSFVLAPYKYPSVDDLIRYCFYMTVPLIVIREFDDDDVGRMTKVLIWTAGICSSYGVLQIIDTHFFPLADRNAGIDPFLWRGAFGKRVFSTFGNPNFFGNFLVLIFPIVFAQMLKRRNFGLAPLALSILANIYFTETKGAWIGFVVMISLFMTTYAFFFMGDNARRALKRVAVIIAILVTLLGGLLYVWVRHRFTSVSFRVLTWLSTCEMIEAHPWLGTGVGSFKVIYPAYRRPGIFHIEGKHNTETDHAEDEYLEQWFDRGALGFAIFLWLVLATTILGFRALKIHTGANRGPPPGRAYDILGYLMAFLGMLAHNFFDVSMRFVSSGVYLGLLPGLVVNLAHGAPLRLLAARENAAEPERAEPAWRMGARVLLSLGAGAGLLWFARKMFVDFAGLQGPLNPGATGGETLQWWISWGVFCAVTLGLTFSFLNILLRGRRLMVPLFIGLMLHPLLRTWGFFKADVHHNMAIFFSKKGDWDNALSNYLKVIEYNPAFIMAYYFMGNVFNDRFDMTKKYNENWGDRNHVPRDDLQRAGDSYAQLRAMAPNYVQMHHQVGVLYLKMAEWLKSQGRIEESERYVQDAFGRFDLYFELDPVFKYNYYRKAQVYLAKREFDKAIEIYKQYIDAPRCYVHKHDFNPDFDSDAFTQLANAYFMKGDLKSAVENYQQALRINPNEGAAHKNLAIALDRARKLGLLREPAPAPPSKL